MNLLIKRRQLVLATLVVALSAAVFVNWYYSGTNNKVQSTEETTESNYVQNLGEAKYVNATGETADYFDTVRLNREKSRDKALEELNESLKNVQNCSDDAAEITRSIEALSNTIKQEGDIEALVSGKLGSECVAVVGETTVQIVVAKGALNDETALQIMEIVTKNTGVGAENISITESK